MKRKKKQNKLVWVVIILVIVLIAIIYFYLNPSSSNATTATTSSTTTTTTEVEVSTQTITKTLSSSGQISSSKTENLELNTSKYLKEIYVEENDLVESGENILKYTDGTYVTASYDCIVSNISIVASGEQITSSNYIEVQSTEELYMTLSVEETEINSVKVDQEAEISVTAYSDKTYTGTITKINEIGTYSSSGSSFTATITFENDGDIKIGMSASCTVILEKAENVIAVPVEAIQTANNTKYVVVVNTDGTTKNVTIETGISNDAYIEIKSGLDGTETIQMTVETTTSTSGRGSMSGGGQMSSDMQMPSDGMQMTSGSGMQKPSN